MTRDKHMFDRIVESISIDEFGFETGHYGNWVLKSRYQTVFRVTDKLIAMPWAVRGVITAFNLGKNSPFSKFEKTVDKEDDTLIAGLTSLLKLRNYFNLGGEGLSILVDHHPQLYKDLDTALGYLDLAVASIADIWLNPEQVIYQLGMEISDDIFNSVHAELQSNGLLISVPGFPEHRSVARQQSIKPALIELDRNWFLRCMQVPAAIRLLSTIIHQLQREGQKVLISGIASKTELQAALETGADYLEGQFLRLPTQIGHLINNSPLNLQVLLSEGENIICFSGNIPSQRMSQYRR